MNGKRITWKQQQLVPKRRQKQQQPVQEQLQKQRVRVPVPEQQPVPEQVRELQQACHKRSEQQRQR